LSTENSSKNYETLAVERRGQVEWLTLNRPGSLNAISTMMMIELSDYFGKLFHDGGVRVVVMRGAGRAFCAGLDVKVMSGESPPPEPFGGGLGHQGLLSDVYVKMRRCPQPIISLLQGPVCGGGFGFALASDVRIAGESARMKVAANQIGLSACDGGMSYFLPRLIGLSVASELMFTGRTMDAARALATGLVSAVVPDEQLEATAEVLVDEMLLISPLGLRLTKEGLGLSVDAPSLEAVLASENRTQILCGASGDALEGMRAFVEKRRPVYRESPAAQI
jgi:enoyl-CoA hydratase/carnithine racemase